MDNEKKVLELNLDDILPNRFQPRIKFNEEAINELAESIKEHGVIQPIIVRPIGDKYEIIAGERRYKASVIAGKTTIPAIVTNLNDRESAEIALIENVQREDLSPIEEAISYRKILDMGLTQDQLADKLDRNQSTIANKLRLLNLEDAVQEALLNNEISERHARSLLRLHDSMQQVDMLERIINERLTVRKTDEEIDKLLNNNSPIKEPDIWVSNNEEKGEIMDNKENMNLNIPSEPIINDIDDQPIDLIDINNHRPELLEAENQEPVVESFEKNIEKDFINNPNIENIGFLDIDKIETEAKDIHTDKPVPNIDDLLQVSTGEKANEEVLEEEPAPEIESQDQPVEDNIWTNKFFSVDNFESEEEPALEENNEIFGDVKSENILPTGDEVLNNKNTYENMPFTETENSESDSDPAGNIFNPAPGFDTNELETANLEVPVDNVEYDDIYDSDTLEEYKDADDLSLVSDVEVGETGVDLKTVINTIRDCASRIEKMGYVIETEELDFENEYRVTFKINK